MNPGQPLYCPYRGPSRLAADDTAGRCVRKAPDLCGLYVRAPRLILGGSQTGEDHRVGEAHQSMAPMATRVPEPDQRETPASPGLYPIRTVASLTGVHPVTLRAWERRYGLFKPERTPKGHRLYSREQLHLIQRVVGLLAQGVSIGQARSVLGEEPGASTVPKQDPDLWSRLREQMLSAIRGFDTPALDLHYHGALALLPVELVIQQLLIPLLVRLGEQWSLDGDRHRRGALSGLLPAQQARRPVSSPGGARAGAALARRLPAGRAARNRPAAVRPGGAAPQHGAGAARHRHASGAAPTGGGAGALPCRRALRDQPACTRAIDRATVRAGPGHRRTCVHRRTGQQHPRRGHRIRRGGRSRLRHTLGATPAGGHAPGHSDSLSESASPTGPEGNT